MAAHTNVSVEAFLMDPAYERFEYIDGELIQKPVPSPAHGVLAGWLAALIYRYFPQFVAGPEIRSRLRETEYRLPDLCIGYPASFEGERYLTQAVYLCIEILSPENDLSQTAEKMEHYHDWGVPYCWIFDPETRRAWTYPRGGKLAEVNDFIEAGEIRLAVPEIFSVLDRVN
jgi:Uma2 family endonuclease